MNYKRLGKAIAICTAGVAVTGGATWVVAALMSAIGPLVVILPLAFAWMVYMVYQFLGDYEQ